jgi:hypothetical protein
MRRLYRRTGLGFQAKPKRTFATMVCGFGGTGARATGLIQPPGKKFFAVPPQISCRRGALGAKFIENLRKQAQCAYLLPSGGM